MKRLTNYWGSLTPTYQTEIVSFIIYFSLALIVIGGTFLYTMDLALSVVIGILTFFVMSFIRLVKLAMELNGR